MDVEKLKAASGADLDAAGVEMKLDRATTARGHAFDETDDSYRRRLVAVIAGASAADALSQPAMTAEESGPVAVLKDGTVIRGKAAEEILRLRERATEQASKPESKPQPEPGPKPELKQDGPTVEEWVLAGYPAKAYPPHGYASRSTAEEIAAAIAAQDAAKTHIPADDQGGPPDATGAGTDGKTAEAGSAAAIQPAKPLP